MLYTGCAKIKKKSGAKRLRGSPLDARSIIIDPTLNMGVWDGWHRRKIYVKN
jgi:hypothetical protein